MVEKSRTSSRTIYQELFIMYASHTVTTTLVFVIIFVSPSVRVLAPFVSGGSTYFVNLFFWEEQCIG